MKTFICDGQYLSITAPYAVSSGGGVQVGTAIFGIAAEDIANGAVGKIMTAGVFTIAKTSALQISVGDRLFWDNTNKVVDKTATAQLPVGVAVSAAANPSSTVNVLLCPVPPANAS